MHRGGTAMNSSHQSQQPFCIGLGEVLFDLLPSGARLGGAPANFAYIAAKLGARSAAVSAVGQDDLAEAARSALREKGLTAYLAETECVTGHVKVTFHGEGIPSYAFAEKPAYEAIPFTEELERVAGAADICCFGSMAQWGPETRRTVRQFLGAMRPDSFRVFDVNLRGQFYNREILEGALPLSTAVKCNESELPILCGMAGLDMADAESYRKYLETRGIFCFIYTEGAERSTVWRKGECSMLPTPACQVEDTVGAGDSFTAALAVGLWKGLSLAAAHQLAVWVSAYVCGRSGAMPDFPVEAAGWAEEYKREEDA